MITRQKLEKRKGSQEQIPSPNLKQKPFYKKLREKISEISRLDLVSISTKESEQKKNERKKAMEVGDAAMKTWGKFKGITDSDEKDGPSEKPKRRKRRSGGNALQYLEAKFQADAEVKKKEVALRQHELALQQKLQEHFEAQMLQKLTAALTVASIATATAVQYAIAANLTNSKFNTCFIAESF